MFFRSFIAHAPIRKLAPGSDMTIKATVSSQQPITGVRLAYRSGEGDYRYVNMQQTEPLLYRAAIPAANITAGLNYFIEAVDQNGRRATYPNNGQAQPVAVIVTDDNEPPWVSHKPVTSAPALKPLTITAEVSDPSGVKWVRLLYRSVNQHQDYQTLDMLPTGKANHYQAVIPGEHIVAKWDLMYLIEVMDKNGNGKIYPDLYKETPYVVVKLRRQGSYHE